MPTNCLFADGCSDDFGVALLSGEHDDVADDDDVDDDFFGTSMNEPPDSRPARILNGLGSAFIESGDGEIEMIDPPDEPNRGTVSSLRATILMSPPHICNIFDSFGVVGTGEKLLVR